MFPKSMRTRPSSGAQPVLVVGEFRLDPNLRLLYRGSERITITAKPFSTLEYLVRNRHRIVSKAELLEVIWGGRREISTVEHAIGQVRRALGDDAEVARYIETVHGQGYRLLAEVHYPVAAHPDPVATDATELAGGVGIRMKAIPRPRFGRVWRVTGMIAAAVLACVGGVAAVWFFNKPARVSRTSLNGNTLSALNAEGRTLWTYEFGSPLKEASPGQAVWRNQLVDVDGDGVPEVLAAVRFGDAQEYTRGDGLFCFSSRGKLLWNYRPEIRHGFQGPELKGPWIFTYMLVTPEGGHSSIWAAIGHWLWWPGFVVRLSGSGEEKVVFVNSGQIYALLNVRAASGNYMLAGGVNNEYQRASLAMLARDGPPATSPQNEERYRCARGCPLGRPYRYILFPRSELSMASDEPYNRVAKMYGSEGVTVYVSEGYGDASTYYGFSRELQPEWVRSADNWGLHKQAEREGRIHHTFENCPERRKPAILRICDENGDWSEVSVPRLPARSLN